MESTERRLAEPAAAGRRVLYPSRRTGGDLWAESE